MIKLTIAPEAVRQLFDALGFTEEDLGQLLRTDSRVLRGWANQGTPPSRWNIRLMEGLANRVERFGLASVQQDCRKLLDAGLSWEEYVGEQIRSGFPNIPSLTAKLEDGLREANLAALVAANQGNGNDTRLLHGPKPRTLGDLSGREILEMLADTEIPWSQVWH